jgi:single-strand DNA-binding protein
MANRNVNKVILIGNLTRDPEVRYTPQGTAVANFTVATNRSWSVDGVTKEAVDFHNIVSWNKLAELCGQLLSKGTMVYVEGRLQTRNWEGEDGERKYKTEVNIDEMIVLKSKSGSDGSDSDSEDYSSDDSNTASGGDDDINIDDLLDEIEESVEASE